MAGVTAALMLGSSAMSAVGSIQQGVAEKRQAEANAQIYDAQAKNIAVHKNITAEQYRTKANVLRGQATATAAKGGLKISGTTASSISQSIMQLQMDNSYEQYNLNVEKYKALMNANIEKEKGRAALTGGFLQAGATALKAGYTYYDKYWNGTKESNNNSGNWFNNFFNKPKKYKSINKQKKLSGGFDYSNSGIINPTEIV